MTKVWLITGSSRGLGRALAEAVLAAGHKLVATARNPQQVADLVERYPDRSRALALDVTDRAQAEAAIRAAVERFGRIDVLVNNAGYANVNAIEDFAEDDFRDQIETNLWGVINLTRAALPVMRAQRSGHIVQISSIGGFRTDWAGSSMTTHEIREEYRPTVGRMTGLRSAAVMRGDPRKGAQAILRITEVETPPLRLLLGSDAYAIARAADQARLDSDKQWKELTLSTDFDDVRPFVDQLDAAARTSAPPA